MRGRDWPPRLFLASPFCVMRTLSGSRFISHPFCGLLGGTKKRFLPRSWGRCGDETLVWLGRLGDSKWRVGCVDALKKCSNQYNAEYIAVHVLQAGLYQL